MEWDILVDVAHVLMVESRYFQATETITDIRFSGSSQSTDDAFERWNMSSGWHNTSVQDISYEVGEISSQKASGQALDRRRA